MITNKIFGIFLLVFILVFNAQSHAQSLEQKLKECSEISVSLIRLQCYDRITENPEVQNVKPVRERSGLLSRLGRSSENTNDEKEEKETETVAKDDSSQASKSGDNFGLIIRDERDSIQSRILGEFKGWDGYTKFNLENGQVWQQSSAGVLRVKISNPTITIKRSRVSDTYMLKIEGLNSSVRVKRVE
ncbi:MAG: hypothetical protein CMQ73_05885 [Gammaproteobacteria bacterium]|nr:hypothetical protein [Gammaproteobacteria bacterium]OUT93729.1 MAG: hypothetical protein CBB96_07570 [Gammaproteobacteria bacterium TMED36]|tara:strand:+ start:263 stop:826 length:564 start_codon:yes stop_codon:yes gene_type:complete